jgi:kumamolisin
VEYRSGSRSDGRVYAAGSVSYVDLDKALDRIIADLATQPGIHQLSISLGLGEDFIGRDEVAAEHLKFLRLAARGVNTFVASGDAGSNPDITGHRSSGPLQVEYESFDPTVMLGRKLPRSHCRFCARSFIHYLALEIFER